MTIPRVAATAVLALRVSYGLALIAAPRRLALRWLGPAAEDAPAQVALRSLGAREAVLHTGDLTDAVATVVGAALVSVVLAVAVDS